MKAITVIIFLLLFLSADAQKFRINAGVSYCKLNWNTVPNTKLFDKAFTSYTAGVGIEYLKTGLFNLSSNIEYLRKGGIDDITYTDAMGNDLYTRNEAVIFNFIHVNTFARIKMPMPGKIKPFINLGVYGGYMVSANNLAGDESEYKRLTAGAVTGIGIGYKIIGKEIGVEAQYLPSFIPLYDKQTAGSTRKITDKTFAVKLFLVM